VKLFLQERNEAIVMSNVGIAIFGWMSGFTIFVLVLCSINTLLLLQLFAEFLQDPESSGIVEFASPNDATAPASISTCSAPLSPLPSLSLSLANWTVLWHAPFFSGGGYCSEAWSYFYLLQAMGADVRVVQHGDGVDNVYVSQMNDDQKHAAAASYRPINRRIISICHSEPGAWSAPSPRFQTSRCPHPLAEVAVGRTMFETDRLPHGWAERLLHMHRVRVANPFPLLIPSFAPPPQPRQVWVPTPFHHRIFAQGGDDALAARLRVLPQTVEEASAGCAEPHNSPSISRINTDSRFKFLAVGKWERRKGWDVLLRAWCAAFPAAGSGGEKSQEVLLVRTASYHSSSDFGALIDAELSQDVGGPGRAACAPIELLPPLKPHEMKLLYQSVQAFVSTSHGEGWGRPLAEAAGTQSTRHFGHLSIFVTFLLQLSAAPSLRLTGAAQPPF
jgi:glycosyltransferase involved in cell wall biosynthesis